MLRPRRYRAYKLPLRNDRRADNRRSTHSGARICRRCTPRRRCNPHRSRTSRTDLQGCSAGQHRSLRRPSMAQSRGRLRPNSAGPGHNPRRTGIRRSAPRRHRSCPNHNPDHRRTARRRGTSAPRNAHRRRNPHRKDTRRSRQTDRTVRHRTLRRSGMLAEAELATVPSSFRRRRTRRTVPPAVPTPTPLGIGYENPVLWRAPPREWFAIS